MLHRPALRLRSMLLLCCNLLHFAVGMLVDNSVVVIENIFRLRNEEGYSIKEASIEGAKQVGGAILASTLTTICVFAPIDASLML